MNSVLVVCVGNICRSPMAEGLLKRELPHLGISSAGIHAVIGEGADSMAKSLMIARGVDIEHHIARQLNTKLCQKSDLILVMESDHRRYIEERFPYTRGKVFRLAEQLKKDIPDPYKRDRAFFESTLALIEAGTVSWVDRIKKITENGRQFT